MRCFTRVLLLFSLVLLSAAASAKAGSDPLTDEEAQARFEEILPKGTDTSYASIDWRSTVLEAVTDANACDKPILLWQMRGHPLGAT